MADKNYSGRRAQKKANGRATNYQGRRKTAQPEVGPLQEEAAIEAGYTAADGYSPTHAEGDQPQTEAIETPVEPDEEPLFAIAPGRRKAVIESTYSSEINGGIVKTYGKKSHRGLIAIVSAMAILAIAAVGIFIFKGPSSSPNAKPTNDSAQINVLPEAHPSTKPGVSAYTEVKLNAGVFSTPTTELRSKFNLVESPSTCSISNAIEFCYAGDATVTDPASTYRVFYTGDIVNSQVFANAYDFLELVKGDAWVDSIVTDFGGQTTRFLLYGSKANPAGWFVEVPLDISQIDATKLAENFDYTAK